MTQCESTTLIVKHEFKGKRIDKYLVSRLQDFSRTFVQGLINNGDIRVCDRVVKNSYEVQKNDVITIILPELPDDDVEPENIPLNVVYEDDHILIINKPPDMVVHPSRGHARGTLVNAVKYYCDNLSGLNGNLRPGIVHRLDRDTTGVIIVAKTDFTHGAIARQFENREVKKQYTAVVEGIVSFDSDLIDLPIGRDKRFREKMAIRYDVGKRSISEYKVKERFLRHSVVHVYPKTGRTHQIRVHMKNIGHPVVADQLYSNNDTFLPMNMDGDGTGEYKPIIARQALHATRIEIMHPVSEKVMTFEAPLPDDMNNLIMALRSHQENSAVV